MSLEAAIILAIITALVSPAIWQNFLQRFFQRSDKREQEQKETSTAQIVDRQLMVNELWVQVAKLQQAESEWVAERIRQGELIAELRADKRMLEAELKQYRPSKD